MPAPNASAGRADRLRFLVALLLRSYVAWLQYQRDAHRLK
jgi:hypothetical protein